MNVFWKRFIAVNLGIAAVIASLGAIFGWTTSQFTMALTLTSLFAFFVGTASVGGTGPRTNIRSGVLSGNMFEVIARGEEVKAMYEPVDGRRGDYFARWRARGGWNPGNVGASR